MDYHLPQHGMSKQIACALLLVTLALQACAPAPNQPVALTVAAASSMQNAFSEIGALFEAQTGQKVIFVFASSGQLTQQIENGAPYDLFAAANIAFIDRLEQQNLVLTDTIARYARGRIVLAVNKNSGLQALTLDDLLSNQITHIAIANPEHAPYGVAAMEALQSAGVWEQVRPKLVYAENIRQALQFIQTGDAQVGIIALSDANVPEIAWTLLDETLHNPLDQALAVLASSPNHQNARQFANFINSPEGIAILAKYGFSSPNNMLNSTSP
jgi:molybdate transport system substrate-binding protein